MIPLWPSGARRRSNGRDDLHLLEREHPFADHLVEDRHHAVDLLRRVDDLDHDGEILGEPQDPRGMEPRVRAEPLDPSQDGRPRQPLLAHALDDRLVERLAVPSVGLPDEKAQKLAFSFELHSALAATTPT
jgi:hypothetical protein